MNYESDEEKVDAHKRIAAAIITGFVVGMLLFTVPYFFSDYYRKSDKIGDLDRQLSNLDREHRARQRDLEANLGDIGNITENAIATLEGARIIIERPGSELHSATANLRDAKNILKNLAIQIQDLQSELDSCRAGLYRIRDLAGMETGEEVKPP
jgi:peptidoglycan hydrolase CwlO-like protein